MTPANGRYALARGKAIPKLQLRLELFDKPDSKNGAGLLSGEFQRAGKLVSFLSVQRRSSTPAVRLTSGPGETTIAADVRFGPFNYERGQWGTASLHFGSAKRATLTLRGGSRTQRVDATAPIKWVNRYYRDLTIEVDAVAGAKFRNSATFRKAKYNLAKIFQAAGFNAKVVVSSRTVPDDATGWSTGELHVAMQRHREKSRGPWYTYALIASNFEDDLQEDAEDVTLGVMFDAEDDDTNHVPREGCAVFFGGHELTFGARILQRELLMTAAHEIGHTLSLHHSFEKDRADSISLMNYPEEYVDGAAAYYRQFRFTFDPEEVVHLRHHSPEVTEPGRKDGADFFKTSFRKSPGLRLSLLFPAPSLLVNEPVSASVSLTNSTRKAREVHTSLEWLTGLVTPEVLAPGETTWRSLRPPLLYCRRPPILKLAPGETITRELRLYWSTTGEIFKSPGNYKVRATLTYWPTNSRRRLVVRSQAVALSVNRPATAAERSLVRLFRTPDLKRYLLIPGGALDPRARKAAASIQERAPQRPAGRAATLALASDAQNRFTDRRLLPKRFTDPNALVKELHDVSADPVAAHALGPRARRLVQRSVGQLAQRKRAL